MICIRERGETILSKKNKINIQLTFDIRKIRRIKRTVIISEHLKYRTKEVLCEQRLKKNVDTGL